MQIAVIGGGVTGAVLIRELVRYKEVDRVLCVAKDERRTREFLRASPHVRIIAGDVLRDAKYIAGKIKGSTVVVNAASPWLNIPILKLALGARAHYQDLEAYLGFDDKKAKMPYAIEHLAYAKAFKRNNRLALFDSGVAPGLTNLLVAEEADRTGTLEKVVIRMIEDIDASVIISTWSPHAAVDEIYSRPVIYKKGAFRTIPPFSDPKDFVFPAPFGRKTTYSVMNNESFTVPRYVKVREMEVRSAGSDDEAARIMINLGLLDKKPIHLAGVSVVPLEFLMNIMPPPPTPRELRALVSRGLVKNGFFAVSIEAHGRRNGRPYRSFVWVEPPSQHKLFLKRIHTTYIAYPAGVCAAAFTPEFPHIAVSGTLPPEGLPRENRSRILERIRKSGIRISRRELKVR